MVPVLIGFGFLAAFLELALGEVGSRAIVGLSVGAYEEGETTLFKPLPERLESAMLCLCDRSFFGFESWELARASGAELLRRPSKNAVFAVEERLPDGSFSSRAYASPNDRGEGLPGVVVRVIEHGLHDPGRQAAEDQCFMVTTILDPEQAPAKELAALYAQRWKVELSLEEVEIRQGRPSLVLRSRKPDGVIQELYGFASAQ